MLMQEAASGGIVAVARCAAFHRFAFTTRKPSGRMIMVVIIISSTLRLRKKLNVIVANLDAFTTLKKKTAPKGGLELPGSGRWIRSRCGRPNRAGRSHQSTLGRASAFHSETPRDHESPG